MAENTKIVQAIFKAIDDVNLTLPDQQKLEKSMSTLLFGKSGRLDSLGLVNLIVAVEGRLEEDLGTAVVLADEKALSQKQSPFKTVGNLAEYIASVLEENAAMKQV